MQKNAGKECIQINVCWFAELEITEKKYNKNHKMT